MEGEALTGFVPGLLLRTEVADPYIRDIRVQGGCWIQKYATCFKILSKIMWDPCVIFPSCTIMMTHHLKIHVKHIKACGCYLKRFCKLTKKRGYEYFCKVLCFSMTELYWNPALCSNPASWMRLASSRRSVLQLKTARFLTHDSQFCFAASVSCGGGSAGKQSRSHFLDAVFGFSPLLCRFLWPHTNTRRSIHTLV